MDTVCVVNPASGNGRTGRRWPEVSRALSAAGVEHESRLTERIGHATELAAAALAGGARTVVAVGGDGTLNEVVGGFFAGDGPPPAFGAPAEPAPWGGKAAVGLLPLGTGGDFRRTLGIPTAIDAAAAMLRARNLRRIDAGRIEMAALDGGPCVRHFVNIADAGIGGEVVERVNRTTKLFGGRASFQYAAMATLLTYEPPVVSVESAEGTYQGPAQNVVVANCRYFGGGMWVAPEAEPDDGLFDVVLLGDIKRLKALRSINDIYKGRHLSNPEVRTWRTAELTVSSTGRVLVDVDGEMCGTLPATFRVLPKALSFVVP
jgi:YegS/Rv2252/BmrU family lipid kinase